MYKRILFGVIGFIAMVLFTLQVEAAPLQTNPNVTWSPDGEAFTTDAGETHYVEYNRGTTVNSGGVRTLREPEEGEHKYSARKTEGNIPIAKWEVAYTPGLCVHDKPSEDFDHGFSYGFTACESAYKPGWLGYCADCDQRIHLLFYMDTETAQSIKDLPIGKYYYYKCPICDKLEQAAEIVHECTAISWNQYEIAYNKNSINASGYMENSLFMYNNETIYEGDEFTPETKLQACKFIREGYEFIGWNTEPDGSGRSFVDEEEIYNLTTDNNVTITLYAQWEKCESTLQIDPNGGSYDGKSEVTSITKGYGTTLSVLSSKITAPKGHTVKFETNGGVEIADVTAERIFSYWQLSDPFHGKFENETYTFKGENGSVDKITAIYKNGSIVLPDCTSEDNEKTFGGWYKDGACTIPAGKPGEEFLITEDTVFYAKWVELKLNATDNYIAYGGAGAVDLSWSQTDGTAKTYLLYQSLDRLTWKKLSFNGSGATVSVTEDFSATGEEKTYTVPYSGLYTITAAGAQGENYDAHVGGKGGQVKATVWLAKGEILTYKIGTSEGYNGGGTGTPYGNGGGMTSVSSNLKGLLLVAGGGGGASSLHDGGVGGSSQSIISDSSVGGSGGAGGGGGYKGGTAGEAVIHNHTDDCYYVEDIGYLAARGDYVYIGNTVEITNSGVIKDYSGLTAQRQIYYFPHTDGNSYTSTVQSGVVSGVVKDYIPTNGCEKMKISVAGAGWGAFGSGHTAAITIKVYDQSENLIFTTNSASLPNTSTKYEWNEMLVLEGESGKCMNYQASESTNGSWGINFEQIEIDVSDVTGVRYEIIHTVTTDDSRGGCWMYTLLRQLKFEGENKLIICEYADKEDGYVVSAKQAFGGSNYVNTSFCSLKSDSAGVQNGNGSLQINMAAAEYVDALSLNSVSAPDLVTPDAVNEDTVTKTSVSADKIKVLWETPKDYGTPYYHRAESYNANTGEKLCDSNITVNTLVSGIKGYRYVIDTREVTTVTTANLITTSNALTVTMTENIQYLHLAAEDKAGNLSGTINIKIGTLPSGSDPEGDLPADVASKLFTEQITISGDNGNVHAAGGKTWYVKADGETSFALSFNASMEGHPLSTYQINHMIFESELEGTGTTQRYQISAPSSPVTEEEITYKARTLTKEISGAELLNGASYTIATRKNYCKDMTIVQKFYLSSDLDGTTLSVIPIAGANHSGAVVYSDLAEDSLNGIKLIADAKAPDVAGIEILENLDSIDLEAGTVILDLTSSDTGSGVKELYAVVSNIDNYIEKTFTADPDGHLRIDLTDEDDYVFKGDFNITIYAVDNVGNVTELSYKTEFFSLTASVEKMREPHGPLLKQGDTGILHIVATGYVDKIEVEILDPLFPETILFEYDSPESLQEENVEFFVPLYTPEGIYEIKVNAYKNGNKLNAEPVLGVFELSGSVLEEFRRKINWNS